MTDEELDEWMKDPRTQIDIAYRYDEYIQRTLFGYKLAHSFRGHIEPEAVLPPKKNIKAAIKKAGAKVRIGETFVWSPEAGGATVFRKWGVPCGNLQGHDFTIDEINFVLSMPNVYAVVFHRDDMVVYYEADQYQDVPSLQDGDD